MSIHDAKARLARTAERLSLRWRDVQAEWRDGKSREFENDVLLPLTPQVSAAVSAIDRLSEVMARAERDCR